MRGCSVCHPVPSVWPPPPLCGPLLAASFSSQIFMAPPRTYRSRASRGWCGARPWPSGPLASSGFSYSLFSGPFSPPSLVMVFFASLYVSFRSSLVFLTSLYLPFRSRLVVMGPFFLMWVLSSGLRLLVMSVGWAPLWPRALPSSPAWYCMSLRRMPCGPC